MTRIAVALVHHPCLDKHGQLYTTSITNLDVHDLARSCRTFDVSAFYVVTPIAAQQQMAHAILSFWDEGSGAARNPDRKEALSRAQVVSSVQEALAREEAAAGAKPALVATSAREQGVVPMGDFRARIPDLPAFLLLFGTGHGMADELMRSCDVVLAPIRGRPGADGTTWNHLSVRSAAAIVLDRLLGDR